MTRFLLACLAVALCLAPVHAQQDPGDKATIAYVQKLQTNTGGFLAAKPTPKERMIPALRATSSAIRALKYLGADVWSRRSTKELPTSLRSTVDEDEMKQVIKKFPRTKWADLADYHFIENKLCGDWLGKPDCPEKETNIYEEYVKNHPNSPKAQEALLKAASRQAALIQIYATEEQPGKIPGAKQRAAALAKRAFDAKTDSDDAQRAQRLLYMVEHDIATYGNALD